MIRAVTVKQMTKTSAGRVELESRVELETRKQDEMRGKRSRQQ